MLSKSAHAIVGIIVIALSFSATLFALNLWSGYPLTEPLFTASIPSASPAPSAPPAITAVAPETSLEALPKLASAGFQWVGIAHLNVQTDTGKSVVAGQPVMRLLATAQDGYHTLAGQFSGLNKNQVYRVTAWVKPEGDGNLEFETSDRPSGQPLNHAEALFNLASRKVLDVNAAVKERGLDQGPDGWQKVWLNLMTSDGQIVITLRPANGGAVNFKGDGRLGLTLGGVEIDPQG
jgi:hypothetical protein